MAGEIASMTDEGLQQLYQQKILMPTGTFSAREVEEEIQAGRQISEEQFAVLNNYRTVKQQSENLRPTERQAQQQQQTVPLQTQENVGFFTKLKNDFLGLFSKKSAKGSPVQKQKPVKQTVKWKDTNQVRDRIAKNYNSRADRVSYEMVQQSNNYNQMKQNSLNEAKRRHLPMPSEENNYYGVAFQHFLQGYRTNADGYPATREDAKRRDADIEWTIKYLSTNKTVHNSALDSAVDGLLQLKLTPAMLKNSYIDSHMGEVCAIRDKFKGLELMQEKNIDYFELMDPIKRELLEVRVENFHALFSSRVLQRLYDKGLTEKVEYQREEPLQSSQEENTLTVNKEKKKDWFSKREQTEKMVAELEQSKKLEEEKSLAGLPSGWKSSYDIDKEEIGVAKNSSALSMEKLEESGHVQEYTRDKMLIDMCISGLEKECNLLDASKLASLSYAAAVKPIESKDDLSPEQARMKDLAFKKASFEYEQSLLHAGNRNIYKNAINDLLTGEQPSEEFWKLFEHAHNSMVAKNMRNRIEGKAAEMK